MGLKISTQSLQMLSFQKVKEGEESKNVLCSFEHSTGLVLSNTIHSLPADRQIIDSSDLKWLLSSTFLNFRCSYF